MRLGLWRHNSGLYFFKKVHPSMGRKMKCIIFMSICANKFHGIRAALCGDCYSAEMTRKHNDANVLCLGGRVIGIELAKCIVDTWLSNEFIGSYHQNRLDKIAKVERGEDF